LAPFLTGAMSAASAFHSGCPPVGCCAAERLGVTVAGLVDLVSGTLPLRAG